MKLYVRLFDFAYFAVFPLVWPCLGFAKVVEVPGWFDEMGAFDIRLPAVQSCCAWGRACMYGRLSCCWRFMPSNSFLVYFGFRFVFQYIYR